MDTSASDTRWTPGSRSLTDAAAGLADLMAQQNFDLFRITYNPDDWDDTPRRLSLNGRSVKLGWYRSQASGTVAVSDRSGARRMTIGISHA